MRDVSSYQDLTCLVLDLKLGLAKKCDYPVGGRHYLFLPAWQWMTSNQFVLYVVRAGQGYSMPYVGSPRH